MSSVAGTSYIAKWNGTTWSALGSGANYIVYALAYDSTNRVLYAGGNFGIPSVTGTNYIAKWNGTIWSALGSGANNNVNALAYDSKNNVLYAGGYFTSMSSVAGTSYIAKWNGTTWSALVSGANTNGIVRTLAYDSINNVLYAGGDFTSMSSVAGTSYIAKWDGTTWSALGSGANSDGYVYALAYGSTQKVLYAGGLFTSMSSVPANFIAKYTNFYDGPI